jgi:competence protein ComEA
MKKNRDKEECSFDSADKLLEKKSADDIFVFLVIAIFILAVSVFSSHRQFFQKNFTPAPSEATEEYVWLAGSPEMQEGLYLFTPEQLKNNFPGIDFLKEKTTQHKNPGVHAIQYNDHIAQPVNLPPAVANIFFQPIPINSADKNILVSLPGIGPVLAEKIVQRRNQHGPFRSKDELLLIAGIGPKKYKALFDHIILD